MTIITNLRILLIAMWLGAALFFSAIVAPGAFAVLRSYHLFNANEIAGAVVNPALSAVNVSGVIISLLLLLSVFFNRRKYRSRAFLAEVISLLVMLAATGVGHWVIAAKLRALRLALAVPIDQISSSDPRRLSFNSLHSNSVKALGIAMIAALVAFACSAYSTRTRIK
ncbi:MAG: DUF4149 domain-containing protein [Pyrinomonadaceae bacterium]